MKPYMRSDRVGVQIQRALSEILQKKIKDPRLKTIIITGVKMSPDLKLARIYFTCPGKDPGNIRKAGEGLDSAKGYLKRILAGALGLRYMPDLRFHRDRSFDYAENIETLLRQINTENGNNHTTIDEEQTGIPGDPHQS